MPPTVGCFVISQIRGLRRPVAVGAQPDAALRLGDFAVVERRWPVFALPIRRSDVRSRYALNGDTV